MAIDRDRAVALAQKTVLLGAVAGPALLASRQSTPFMGAAIGFFDVKILAFGLAGAFAALLLAWSRPTTEAPTVRRTDLALLGFILFGMIGWAFGAPRQAFPTEWLAGFAGIAFIAGLTARVVERPKGEDFVVGVVLLTAAAVTLVTLLEAAGWLVVPDVSRRPVSTLGNRNLVALYVAISVPVLVARLCARVRLLDVVLLAAITLVIIICRSRTVWIATGGFVLAVFAADAWRRFRGQPVFAPFGGPALVLALGLGLTVYNAASWSGLRWSEASPALTTLGRIVSLDSGSGQIRMQQHRAGFTLWREHPLLGVGPTGWTEAAPRVLTPPPLDDREWLARIVPPNSDFVRLAAGHGLLGLLAFAAILVAVVRAGWRSRTMMGRASAGAVALMTVMAAGDTLFFRAPMMALLGLFVGVTQTSAPMVALTRSAARMARPGLVLVAALMAVAAIHVYDASRALHTATTVVAFERAWSRRPMPLEGLMILRLLPVNPQACTVSAPLMGGLTRYVPQDLILQRRVEACAGATADQMRQRTFAGDLRDAP